jgi:thiamine pyrophosphokinase
LVKRIEYIERSKKTFDCVVVLGGNLPTIEELIKLKNIPIIAADSGAANLVGIGIIPDYVIGDLDSIDSQLLNELDKYAKVIYYAEQETNDFEKAVNYAIESKFEEILVLGINGGDYEHALNNWSVFKKCSRKSNLTIYDKGRYAISVLENIKFQARKNELISIIPQPFARLKTNGLKYKLNDEVLELGFREGARNVANSDKVYIELADGEYLLFLDSDLPFILEKN